MDKRSDVCDNISVCASKENISHPGHCIIWHNLRNVLVQVRFDTTDGCPLTSAADCKNFDVPANGTYTTQVKNDAVGEYHYHVVPVCIPDGNPKVIIQ